jgi:hypothetical protein
MRGARVKNKIKTGSNIVYLFCVGCVLALVAYTIYGSYAFWHGPGLASYLSPLMPFMLNTYAMIALSIGTVPMTIACVNFYKYNNVNKSTYKFLKFNLIFLPAYICMISLIILLFEMVTAYGLRDF